MSVLKVDVSVPDEIVCVCGNIAETTGFHTSSKTGELQSPDINGPWDEDTIKCLDCGLTFSQTTGAVLGVFPVTEEDVRFAVSGS